MPQPDDTRLAVPKAYVSLADGWEPNAETANAIMEYARDHLTGLGYRGELGVLDDFGAGGCAGRSARPRRRCRRTAARA